MLPIRQDMSHAEKKDTVILGAGLAGLGAAYTLSRSGMDLVVIEASKRVGGLAKTIQRHGFRFDIGGHRFKTNNASIEQFVRQLLLDKLLVVHRASKILLREQYFDYPLHPWNAISGLGIPTTAKIILDYVSEQLKPRFNESPLVSLEDWVVRNFGRSLFNIYFREYSEKVWGMESKHICKEWLEQRIQRLSLWKAIKKALFKGSAHNPLTLTSEFLYPSLGIGQIAERLKEEIENYNRILTQSRIVRIQHSADKIVNVTTRVGGTDKQTRMQSGNNFISSIPLATLVQLLHPRPPTDVLEAAARLKYRDLVIVTIMLDRARVTDQTWIYLPEKEIPFGRMHEPTNWSNKMAPTGQTLLVTEHFCFRGDKTWCASDEQLADNTIVHLIKLGFIKRHEVIDKVVLRIPRAYPIFEVGYTVQLEKICNYLERYSNLHLIGRAGLFRYYNMDHAIESGIAVAETLLADRHEDIKVAQRPLYATGTGA